MSHTLRSNDAELRQVATQRVDRLRALAHQKIARVEQHSPLPVALPPSPPQSAWSGAAPPRRSPLHPPCRSYAASPKGSHTARFRDGVTVHYRFHPLSGCRVAWLGRRKARGQTMAIVRHPDGTQMHLPEWMTLPSAARLELRDIPRISLRALSDLRELIAPLLLAPEESRTGGRDERERPAVATGGTVFSADPAEIANGQATQRTDTAPFHNHCDDHDNVEHGARRSDDPES